jgi:gas vesicle protein
MADGYDRFDNEGSGGGSFVMGLLTGTVLGAGLGMLFAPKAGSELRSQLSEQAGNLASQAQDGVRKVTENAGEWADRGRDIYGKAREAVVKGADEAQKYVRDNAGPVREAVVKGAADAEKYARDTVNDAQKYARDAVNTVKDTASTVKDTASSYASNAAEPVRSTGPSSTPGTRRS